MWIVLSCMRGIQPFLQILSDLILFLWPVLYSLRVITESCVDLHAKLHACHNRFSCEQINEVSWQMGFSYRHSSIKNDLLTIYIVPNLYAVLSSVKDKNKRFLIMYVYCPCNERPQGSSKTEDRIVIFEGTIFLSITRFIWF